MSKQQSKQEKLDAEKSDLHKLRHTAEHVLHQAVKELYPSIHLALGPATEEGFYFDFDSTPEGREEVKISEVDFPKIEKRMRKIIERNLPVTRHEIEIAEARELFADNPYKLEWLDTIEAKGEKATVYWTGKPDEKGSMVDLCAGPHVDSTGKVKAFKLLSMAGAYWHGDENNKMLTRIYGTAFPSQEELDQYVEMREEAKKRDHRKLGKELDLFTFSELVGPGLPLWTPKGAQLRHKLEELVWKLREKRGYQRVTIPHITKKDLYETSGHWALYKDDLLKINTREGHEFAMKPMNCPHHTQIFSHVPRSYRDMPQRYAETTMVYRDEQTGELNGLSRVRSITQDDAHVFCRESQVKQEAFHIWDIIEEFYQACGFTELKARMSFHDPDNFDKYLGDKASWKKAEDQLISFAEERGAEYFVAKGEAAFYGPKIDFMGYDSLGREWQLSTIQIDRNMPERFDLWCVNEDGEKERIVMLHAAIMGSIERFLSILIEHTAGAFPLWLSPVQVKVLPIADRHFEYADSVVAQLTEAGFRAEVDTNSVRLSKKIRTAQMEKIPYMLIVGDDEVEAGQVGVRSRSDGDVGKLDTSEFVKKLQDEVYE